MECWSERCVRPEGADCREVGERLASLELGNYATRAEREVVVVRWEGKCKEKRLTRKEGGCIVEAASEDDIAMCPRALVPELEGDPKGCERIGEKAKVLLRGAGGQLRPIVGVIGEVPAAVKQLCVEGRWSGEAKRCLMEVEAYEEAERCLGMLDAGDRRAIERRLTSLVKRGAMKRGGGTEPDPWE